MVPFRQPTSVTHTQISASYSGPLPPPETLDKYNQLVPGAADRIIGMAERQSKHREELEQHVVRGNVSAQRLGTWLGFVIAMTAMGGGIWLISIGHSIAGPTIMGIDLASLVSVFVYGKDRQSKELAQKRGDFKS